MRLAQAICVFVARLKDYRFSGSDERIGATGSSRRSPSHGGLRPMRWRTSPIATPQFFSIEPDMTIVGIWLCAGWYKEILALLPLPRGRLSCGALQQRFDLAVLS
ncbi:MAG TPA: hypothetical protein VNK45_05450 [Candidatus Acidoferrales bacterium]|nr:hypothetical protein [Candidatus Acidoferrales bacterium]